MNIPRIAHITWYQGWDKLPSKYESNVRSIQEKNPTWTIARWDENSLRREVAKLGHDYLTKWDALPYMHNKIDVGRFVVLYNWGGASIDTDVVALKGFESTPSINTSNLIVSYNASSPLENIFKNGSTTSLNNATILSSQYNPIIKGLIDYSLNQICEINQSQESCVQTIAGPQAFTNYLNQYKDQITILDHQFFEPCSGADISCSIPETAILDHRHEGSWLSDSSKTIAKSWYWTKKNSIPVLMILLLFVLIFTISKN